MPPKLHLVLDRVVPRPVSFGTKINTQLILIFVVTSRQIDLNPLGECRVCQGWGKDVVAANSRARALPSDAINKQD